MTFALLSRDSAACHSWDMAQRTFESGILGMRGGCLALAGIAGAIVCLYLLSCVNGLSQWGDRGVSEPMLDATASYTVAVGPDPAALDVQSVPPAAGTSGSVPIEAKYQVQIAVAPPGDIDGIAATITGVQPPPGERVAVISGGAGSTPSAQLGHAIGYSWSGTYASAPRFAVVVARRDPVAGPPWNVTVTFTGHLTYGHTASIPPGATLDLAIRPAVPAAVVRRYASTIDSMGLPSESTAVVRDIVVRYGPQQTAVGSGRPVGSLGIMGQVDAPSGLAIARLRLFAVGVADPLVDTPAANAVDLHFDGLPTCSGQEACTARFVLVVNTLERYPGDTMTFDWQADAWVGGAVPNADPVQIDVTPRPSVWATTGSGEGSIQLTDAQFGGQSNARVLIAGSASTPAEWSTPGGPNYDATATITLWADMAGSTAVVPVSITIGGRDFFDLNTGSDPVTVVDHPFACDGSRWQRNCPDGWGISARLIGGSAGGRAGVSGSVAAMGNDAVITVHWQATISLTQYGSSPGTAAPPSVEIR